MTDATTAPDPTPPGPTDPPAPVAAPEGLLIVDKPAGWTSHDVVARTRRLCRTRRVGHAGTLDPMATGVLLLGVGRATKLLTHLVGADKEYLATLRFGATTVTDDAEGEVLERADTAALSAVTAAAVEAALAPQRGDVEQVPSAVSAIKVDGKRSYARVRAGEDVELPPRAVTISVLEVLGEPRCSADAVDVDVRVVCSSGTYVRAIARDTGAALGVGGHLAALRRTRVGPFGVDTAQGLEALAELDVVPLISLADAARTVLPVRELTAEEVRELGHGRKISSEPGAPSAVAQPGGASAESAPSPRRKGPLPTAGFAPDGELVALLETSGRHARPVLVLAPATRG